MENLTKSERIEGTIISMDLAKIETTSERNGYPSHLRDAVIGFESFEQAKEFAEEFGFDLTYFEKRDGWQLWYRAGGVAFDPMLVSCNDYGDDYTEFQPGMGEEDFFESEIVEVISNFSDFESFDNFLEEKKELWEEIQKAEEGQIVIAHCGKYFETVNSPTMYFSHDTKHVAIGCLINWDESEDDE